MTLPVMAPVRIEPRDGTALWELDQLCFPGDIAFSLGTFRRLLRAQRHIGFRVGGAGEWGSEGADRGEQSLLAFIMALREEASAEVVTLDVHPEHRRRGLGRALLRHLHAALRRGGGREVMLQVAEDNASARALYSSEGYAAVGVAPGYYGGHHDAVLMRRVLDE